MLAILKPDVKYRFNTLFKTNEKKSKIHSDLKGMDN